MSLTLLHSEWPKFHRVLAVLSAIGLRSIDTLSGEATLQDFSIQGSKEEVTEVIPLCKQGRKRGGARNHLNGSTIF